MEKSKEKRFLFFRFPLLTLVIFLIVSCSQNQEQIDATRTYIAGDIFGTQTALAPTATITLTPTNTNTSTPGPTATITPKPTGTPSPPTPTLDSEGVERMKLCYEAAIIVYADFKALYMDEAWSREYSQIDENALSTLQTERKSRYQSLIQNGETCIGDSCWNEDMLGVGGIIMSSKDCLTFQKVIHLGNIYIQQVTGKTRGGMGITRYQNSEINRKAIDKAVETLEEALLTIYDLDPLELDMITDPIWQNVHARYGVIIPE